MGTRSLTVLENDEGQEIAVLYRQYDGYLEGHGRELAEFLDGMTLVNGYGLDSEPRKIANGAECLAAQIVDYFKEGVGGFYLHPGGTRDCWENYVYYVIPKNGEILLRVERYGGGEVLFEGTPAELLQLIDERLAADAED